MIKRVFVLGVLLASFTTFACELPRGESLKVGCSYDCDFLYRFRLHMSSWSLGYSTEIISLHNTPNLRASLEELDGVLIPGGADIDPKYYLNNVSSELKEYTQKNLHLVNYSREGEVRDPFEYSLVKMYSEEEEFKDLPMLGICRGFQMMSVAQGIPLYLDIKTEVGIKNRINRFDRVYIEDSSDSLMDSIHRSKSVRGFKIHHQGIRVPYYLENQDKYPLTRVTAFSNNRKIAESIEYTHRPALGVQYHPEKSFPRTSGPVFRWFLKKACEHKNASLKEIL